MAPTVDLPGDGLRAGLLLPFEVIALDAGGDELARGGPTIGSPGPRVCLDTGAAVVEYDGACITPADPWTVETNDGRMLLVPAPDDTHHVDLVLDGVVVDTHLTAQLRLPDRYGGTTLTLAAFRLTAEQAWNPFVVESRDVDGNLLASTPMFRGGEGEGVMPETL